MDIRTCVCSWQCVLEMWPYEIYVTAVALITKHNCPRHFAAVAASHKRACGRLRPDPGI